MQGGCIKVSLDSHPTEKECWYPGPHKHQVKRDGGITAWEDPWAQSDNMNAVQSIVFFERDASN